jgi:ABC-type transport system substrate-binding protein
MSDWVSRRLRRRRLLAAGAFGVVTLGVSGCASPTPATPAAGGAAPGSSPGATGGTPKYGGTIRTMTTLVERNLDPQMRDGAMPGLGNDVCYSQLLTYKWGPDLKPMTYIPQGDLAESWTQPDEMTYLFKMRPGAKWQNIAPVNGREVSAEDVIYSYQRAQSLRVYSPRFTGISKLEAPDKLTLKVTLDKPNPDLLSTLAEPTGTQIIAKEVVDQRGDLVAPPVVGTGPWIFERFVPGEVFTATRNPDYFIKGRPYADRFESIRTPSTADIVNAFRTTQADRRINTAGWGLWGQAGDAIQKAVPNASIQWILLDRDPVELWLNTRDANFGDIRVRQAISKAIDRKAIASAVFNDRFALSSGISMPAPDYNLPESELAAFYARDVEGAKKLLADAGKSSGLTFEALVLDAGQGVFTTIAQLVQANLKDVGVTMTLTVAAEGPFAAQQTAGTFTATIGKGGAGSTNGLLFGRYRTGGGLNYAGLSDAELDKLIDQQATLGKDPAARKTKLQEVQRRAIAQYVYVNLLDYQQPDSAQAEVRGFNSVIGMQANNAFLQDTWLNI